ncbi:MAG: DUF1592 domain-containing protein [Deltaproteobacteria bacterium]|nr:DUF1592 domain-containing protein [Deltaproteobacteria bacterium]
MHEPHRRRVPYLALGWLRAAGLLAILSLVACEGQIAGGDSSTDPRDLAGPDARIVSLGPAVGRRLTREEYVNSLEVVLGVSVEADEYNLPRDERVPQGFRNSSLDLLLSPARVRAYDLIAHDAVSGADVPALVARYASCTELRDDCYDGFVNGVGALLFRRPVTDADRGFYARLFVVAQQEGEGFEAGAALVMRAMLQAPQFLYRLESQKGGNPGDAREVDSFELATRLSFLVWNAAPDQALLDLAASGELGSNIESEVERLLTHPRARRAFRQYIEQWLYLDAIPNMFELGADMKEETYRLFERLVWEEDADFMRAFTEKSAELSGALAEFYGLSPAGNGFSSYDLSAVPERVGFLTNASVLAARTINPSSSMIDRGLFVLNDLFCESVAPPDTPALQDAIAEVAVPETSGLSQRERFAIQSEEALCLGCHARFDPLGLAFEQYGSAGQYITEDEFGNPLPGGGRVELGDLSFDYSNVEEFAEALGGSETVARCAVEKSVQHAYGRRLGSNDVDLLSEVYADFVQGGRSYRALIRAIATHPDFQLVEVAP